MKSCLIVVLVMICVSAFSGTVTNVFEAIDSTGALIKNMGHYEVSNLNACRDVYGVDGKLLQKRYRVFVPDAEYAAGWGALAQGIKDAAKAAARDERADFDKVKKLVKAAFLVVLDEMNKVKANPSTVYPTNTPAQFRTAIGIKYESLP